MNRSRTPFSVFGMLCGANTGAIAAQMSGITSWPAAKLLLGTGAALGLLVAQLVLRILQGKAERQ